MLIYYDFAWKIMNKIITVNYNSSNCINLFPVCFTLSAAASCQSVMYIERINGWKAPELMNTSRGMTYDEMNQAISAGKLHFDTIFVSVHNSKTIIAPDWAARITDGGLFTFY